MARSREVKEEKKEENEIKEVKEVSPRSHNYKSEATVDSNKFFHKVKQSDPKVNQQVEVVVTVNQGESIGDCLKSLFSCCRK